MLIIVAGQNVNFPRSRRLAPLKKSEVFVPGC
jgi:hypothetical protein